MLKLLCFVADMSLLFSPIDISYLKTIKGMALQDILTEVYNYLELIELPANARVYLLDKMADVE